MKIIKVLIFVFAICGLVLSIMIFCYAGSNVISNKIVDWQSYGQTLYSWLGLFLMVINILIIVLLNNTVNQLNLQLSQNSIEAEKEKLKAQLRYDNFVTFKEEWYDSYKTWQENAQINNQPIFDEFKTIFCQYVNNDSYLEKNIQNLNTVKWWTDKLKEVENIYRTNNHYDVNNASCELSPKIQSLFVEIANNIFSYTRKEDK